MSMLASTGGRGATVALAFAAGFGPAWWWLDSAPRDDGSERHATTGTNTAPPTRGEPARAAAMPQCSPQRLETLQHAVAAAEAELIARWGTQPTSSLEPPTEAELDAYVPDALVSYTSCDPHPCRTTIITTEKIEDVKQLAHRWGYPSGYAFGGTHGDLYVVDLVFVDEPLTHDEWTFVHNARSFDRRHAAARRCRGGGAR